MSLSMKEKKAIIRELKAKYQKAKKKRKKMILDEFCSLTGYNRCYAARVLRAKEKQAEGSARKKRKRHRIYDESTMHPLKKI